MDIWFKTYNAYNFILFPYISTTYVTFSEFEYGINNVNSIVSNTFINLENLSLVTATARPFCFKVYGNDLLTSLIMDKTNSLLDFESTKINNGFIFYPKYFSSLTELNTLNNNSQKLFKTEMPECLENTIGLGEKTTNPEESQGISIKYYFDKFDIYGPILIFMLVIMILLVFVLRLPTPPSNIFNIKHTDQEDSRR